MCDRPLVTFSSLLLEDDLHLALGVLHHCRLYFYLFWGYDGVAAKGVFARTDLVDLREGQNIAHLDVVQTRYSEEVTGSEKVFPSSHGSDDIARWLCADERQCGGRCSW